MLTTFQDEISMIHKKYNVMTERTLSDIRNDATVEKVVNKLCNLVKNSIKTKAKNGDVHYDIKVNFWGKERKYQAKYLTDLSVLCVFDSTAKTFCENDSWEGRLVLSTSDRDTLEYIFNEIEVRLNLDDIYLVDIKRIPKGDISTSISTVKKHKALNNMIKNFNVKIETSQRKKITLDSVCFNLAYFI